MACACKVKNSLNKKNQITDLNHKAEKKGFMYFIKMSFEWLNLVLLGRLIVSLVIFCVVLVLLPLMCLSLIATQLMEGRARVIVPNSFMEKISRIEKLNNKTNE